MKIVANPACRALFLLLVLLGGTGAADAAEVPIWLPHYDLDIQLRVDEHRAIVHERVTWTNRHKRPAQTIVFNNHSHFRITSDIGLLAKMLEILRLAPSDAMDFDPEAACQVQKVGLVTGTDPSAAVQPLTFGYQPGNDTALEIALPHPVGEGETVILDIDFNLRLPPKQGRWGQWEGVTFLAQWLPVLAVYDDEHGWQPTPFIPWHQPFFNEAGIYSARIVLPADQKLASSGTILRTTDLSGGLKEVIVAAAGVRDFALFCSARFQEFTGVAHVGGTADAHLAGSAGGPHVVTQDIPVRVLAFPEHAFYAEQMVRVACEAIPVYSRWFGPYAYPQFTVVESYFGWNGNECGGLVMIDVRIFDMPHIASVFIDALLSHEICHQWWYNAVGTNGYRETWMDEGLATYFSHRLMDLKVGKNNTLLSYPSGLTWLPNIRREDYKNYGYLGVCGRGEQTATVVEDMSKFGHLVNLSAMAYDRGSKVLGMIENRMGEAAFFDFMRHVYAKYQFGILLVADFRRELEAFTGQNWGPFFHDWLYGAGMTDWAVDKVRLHPVGNGGARLPAVNSFLAALHYCEDKRPYQATIWLRQCGQICEATVLGICLDGTDCYQVRIPIQPGVPFMDLPDLGARVEWMDKNLVRVDIVLPCRPTQIAVDPDQILVDSNPANNTWKPRCRLRVTPLYTQLEETDLTNSYDRWNFILGPWVYGAAYADPWFARSPMVGIRAGAYRTQELSTGAYLAYRTDDRNIVAGVDGVLDHWPIPHTQVGFILERSLTTWDSGDQAASRGVIYGRYIMTYGDSLYLAPFKYVEVFSAVQSHPLPDPVEPTPGANLFHEQSTMGIHYHMNYLTPYWNPEGGLAIDATYDDGLPIFGEHQAFYRTFGQVSWVKTMPSFFNCLCEVPGLSWIPDTRWAGRLFGGIALPDNAEVFTLGGGNLFRGFDLSQRQGNAVWVASLEWRIPLARGLTYDFCDHVGGLRSIWGSAFYDVGNAYLNNHQQGPIAHAVGTGIYMDITWFGLIERTLIGVDLAKTVNESTPWQAWFRVNFPF
jgi:Peptidase family M1 domain/Omp85 superfamily domain